MAENSQENKYGKLKEKSIDARINAVAASTSRSRKTFLIMTIVCATINVALWNGYLSWVRDMAFPSEKVLISNANTNSNNTDTNIPNTNSNSESKSEEISLCICNWDKLSNFKQRIEKEKKKDFQNINNINSSINGNTNISVGTNSNQGNSNTNSFGNNLATPTPRLDEKNRERLLNEWISSQTISINLLGIRLTTFDLAVLGSFSLIVMMFWLFFVFRRENRAIIPFIKEIYEESKKIEKNTNLGIIEKKRKHRRFRQKDELNHQTQANELTNLVFHSIANNLLFTDIANNDNPMRFVIFGDNAEFEGEFSDIEFERNFLNTILTIFQWLLLGVLGFSIWINFWTGEWFWTIVIGGTLTVFSLIKNYLEHIFRRLRNILVNFAKKWLNQKYENDILKKQVNELEKNFETNKLFKFKSLQNIKNIREGIKKTGNEFERFIIERKEEIDRRIKDNDGKIDAETTKILEGIIKTVNEKNRSNNTIDFDSPNDAEIKKLLIEWGAIKKSSFEESFKKLNDSLKKIDEINEWNDGLSNNDGSLIVVKEKRKNLSEEIETFERTLLEIPKRRYFIFSEKNQIPKLKSIFDFKISKLLFISNFVKWLDNNKSEAYLPRFIFNLLLFLPSITIFFIVLADIASLFDYSAYRNPNSLLIQVICDKEPTIILKTVFFEIIAILSFIFTTYLSVRCKQFVDASSDSLHIFFKEIIEKRK